MNAIVHRVAHLVLSYSNGRLRLLGQQDTYLICTRRSNRLINRWLYRQIGICCVEECWKSKADGSDWVRCWRWLAHRLHHSSSNRRINILLHAIWPKAEFHGSWVFFSFNRIAIYERVTPEKTHFNPCCPVECSLLSRGSEKGVKHTLCVIVKTGPHQCCTAGLK